MDRWTGVFALTAALVAAENIVTWTLPDAASIAFNAALLVVLLGVVRRVDLSAQEVGFGLRATGVSMIAAGLLSLHVLTVVFFVALVRPEAFHDAETPSDAANLVWTLARVLVVTALVEELTFRGVLFALWRRVFPVSGNGWRRGLRWLAPSLVTAFAFGLWHIGPTRDMLADLGRDPTPGPFLAAVAITTTAGVFVFGLLRQLTRGLAGGVLLHAVVNGSVIAASFGIMHGLFAR
jgi:membrane protease YdiL (CAAX protease family)